jgi:hypothetical protein
MPEPLALRDSKSIDKSLDVTIIVVNEFKRVILNWRMYAFYFLKNQFPNPSIPLHTHFSPSPPHPHFHLGTCLIPQ